MDDSNPDVTSVTCRLPSVSATTQEVPMSPTTTEIRTDPRLRRSPRTRRHARIDRSAWTCANCHQETLPPRKRCADCGTSRY